MAMPCFTCAVFFSSKRMNSTCFISMNTAAKDTGYGFTLIPESDKNYTIIRGLSNRGRLAD
jgi:hypothetical protein